MPYAWIDAELITSLGSGYSAYYAYEEDDYNTVKEFHFVLDPSHTEEDSFDIREYRYFNPIRSLKENIVDAYRRGDIWIDENRLPHLRWCEKDSFRPRPGYLTKVLRFPAHKR